jgi:hypothetical protein
MSIDGAASCVLDNDTPKDSIARWHRINTSSIDQIVTQPARRRRSTVPGCCLARRIHERDELSQSHCNRRGLVTFESGISRDRKMKLALLGIDRFWREGGGCYLSGWMHANSAEIVHAYFNQDKSGTMDVLNTLPRPIFADVSQLFPQKAANRWVCCVPAMSFWIQFAGRTERQSWGVIFGDVYSAPQ